MSMSIMGLAGRLGTEVLPTCSMLVTGIEERMDCSEDLILRKEGAQVGSGVMMLMRIGAEVGGLGSGREMEG